MRQTWYIIWSSYVYVFGHGDCAHLLDRHSQGIGFGCHPAGQSSRERERVIALYSRIYTLCMCSWIDHDWKESHFGYDYIGAIGFLRRILCFGRAVTRITTRDVLRARVLQSHWMENSCDSGHRPRRGTMLPMVFSMCFHVVSQSRC